MNITPVDFAESMSTIYEPLADPAADKSSILEPLPAPVENDSSFAVTFQILEECTSKGKPKLIHSRGYCYNIKRCRANATDWQCTIRPKVNPCRAAVIERSDGSFQLSANAHNHQADPGASVSATITATVKTKAAADIFRPASAIVEKVLLDQMTDGPCSSLPRPEYIARAANRKCQQL